MKIYLDDVRQEPEGWVRCYWPEEVISYLETGKVTEISLDHDLGGDDTLRNGYMVVKWIEEQVYTSDFVPPKIFIHSANGVGRKNMWAGIQSIKRQLLRRGET